VRPPYTIHPGGAGEPEGAGPRAQPFAVAALADSESSNLIAVTHRPRWPAHWICSGNRVSSVTCGPSLRFSLTPALPGPL